MTEAIMLFRGDGIVTEMLYPEFEAVLDNVVSMPEWADQQARAAYVVINPRLQRRSVVVFYLDFDETVTADAGWNVPLRQLVEKAEYGPDLGVGRFGWFVIASRQSLGSICTCGTRIWPQAIIICT